MALNSKQRAYLRNQAAVLEPQLHIGKQGIKDEVVTTCDQYLAAHELLKVNTQVNSPDSAREAADRLAEAVGAEVVQVIGRRFVLYRPSEQLIEAGKSLAPHIVRL